jgi:hypothetical protein
MPPLLAVRVGLPVAIALAGLVLVLVGSQHLVALGVVLIGVSVLVVLAVWASGRGVIAYRTSEGRIRIIIRGPGL